MRGKATRARRAVLSVHDGPPLVHQVAPAYSPPAHACRCHASLRLTPLQVYTGVWSLIQGNAKGLYLSRSSPASPSPPRIPPPPRLPAGPPDR